MAWRMAPAHSIRSHILRMLFVSLPLIWLINGVLTSLSLWHEINEISDTQLVQLAHHLISMPEFDDHEHQQPVILSLKKLMSHAQYDDIEAEHMGFAVWNSSGKRLLADDRGQYFSFMPAANGFIHATVVDKQDKKPWRLLYIKDQQHQLLVAVGQDQSMRLEMVLEVIAVQLLLWGAALGVFIIACMIAVKRGLDPLNQLTQGVSAREPSDKTPLTVHAPKEIAPLLDAMNQLFARVAQTIEKEKRFTADAAHELRSPLSALNVQISVLALEIQRLNAHHATTLAPRIEHIHISIKRLNHLIEQLLTLSRLEQEPKNISKHHAIDWSLIVAQLSETLQPLIDARQAHWQVSISESPLRLHADALLIEVMLRNVLDNALRYSPIGSQIDLIIASDRLVVRDNGAGIADTQQLERLSERFYRPAGQNQPGSGLGLSIVNRIAQRYGLQVALYNCYVDQTIAGFEVDIRRVDRQKEISENTFLNNIHTC